MANGIYKPAGFYSDDGIGCLRMYNIQNGRIDLRNIKRMRLTPEEVETFRLERNDLLVNRVNSRELVGKAAVVKESGEVLVFESKNIRIRFLDRLSLPEYANLFFQTCQVREAFAGTAKQTCGQASISQPQIANLLIPLPPCDEQRRIVAKVDELMRLCDELQRRVERQQEARERLSSAALDRLVTAPDPAEFATCWQRICDHFDLLYDAPETLAQLRQTILQLAVRGKLVPQDPNDEPIEVTIRTCRDSDGRQSTQCRSTVSLSGHFPLPAGWCWGTLKDVADHRLGKMLDQAKNTGHFRPYLRNANVQWFRFELDDIKEMRFEDEELDEYEVRPGDLLICEGGHGIGRTAVWDGQLEQVMFQKALHRVRPFACLNGYFLAFCVRAYDASGVLQRYYTGAGIPHLTGKSLARVLFPLPPLGEQRRIVAKVNHLMSLCDSLDTKLRQSQADGDRLLAAAVHHLLNQPAVETESCPA